MRCCFGFIFLFLCFICFIGLIVTSHVLMQVYLQNSKLEDAGDMDINQQLDRLVQLSNFYADHWTELPNVPRDIILPGTDYVIIAPSVL